MHFSVCMLYFTVTVVKKKENGDACFILSFLCVEAVYPSSACLLKSSLKSTT